MRVPVSLMALVVLAGCAKQPAAPAAKPAAAAPATNVAPAAPQPQLVTVSGTVLETMDASDYTYMRLKTSSGETWAAITKTKIAKGDSVTVTNAMVMDGFQSKTLNRTFDHILFGGPRRAGRGGCRRPLGGRGHGISPDGVRPRADGGDDRRRDARSRWPPSTARPPAGRRTRPT